MEQVGGLKKGAIETLMWALKGFERDFRVFQRVLKWVPEYHDTEMDALKDFRGVSGSSENSMGVSNGYQGLHRF